MGRELNRMRKTLLLCGSSADHCFELNFKEKSEILKDSLAIVSKTLQFWYFSSKSFNRIFDIQINITFCKNFGRPS